MCSVLVRRWFCGVLAPVPGSVWREVHAGAVMHLSALSPRQQRADPDPATPVPGLSERRAQQGDAHCRLGLANKNPHSNAKMLGVRHAALSVAHKMQWLCRCHWILMLFLAYPVEPTGCGAAHSKYCGEENINVEKIYGKTETKPFTQNTHVTLQHKSSHK